MSNWVERESKRNNKNLLIWNGIGLAAGAVAGIFLYNQPGDDETAPALIALGVFLLLTIWNCYKGMRRMGEVQITPLWKQVALYGDVTQIAAHLEQEQLSEAAKYKSLTVTRSWLIRKGFFNTWVSPLGDLAWAYKKTTKVYSNYVIPVSKYYSAMLHNRHRQKVEVRLSQKMTDALLADLGARVPWAFIGYSADLAKAWRKDPAGIVAAVDSRYQQFIAKSSATTSAT